MIVRILEGADPAETPVEVQESLEFVVNPSAAERMGVTIPDEVLAKADRTVG
jgi:putative ABC transport system substrate-binding protein